MVTAFIRTEKHRYARALGVEFEGRGRVVIWGDPAKAVAVLLLFNNGSKIGSWTNKGLEVDVDEDVYEALAVLSRRSLTWREAAKEGFLNNPTPQHVLQALSLKAILK